MALTLVHNNPDYKGPIQTQHSGGNGGDDMEVRMARVEADVKNINTIITRMWDDIVEIRREQKSDFKWIIGGFFTVIASTFGAIYWFYDAFKDILLPLIQAVK